MMKKMHLWGTAGQMADSTGVRPLAQQQGNPKIHSPTYCVCVCVWLIEMISLSENNKEGTHSQWAMLIHKELGLCLYY